MLCASLSMGETKLYAEKGNQNGRESLLNEKWLKNLGVLGNKKRNMNKDKRVTRKVRRERESVFSCNAPEGRAGTTAELPGVLKGGDLWGR